MVTIHCPNQLAKQLFTSVPRARRNGWLSNSMILAGKLTGKLCCEVVGFTLSLYKHSNGSWTTEVKSTIYSRYG